MLQFFTETMLTSFLAPPLALLIYELVLTKIKYLSGSSTIPISGFVFFIFLLVTGMAGLITGGYVVFFLLKINPVNVLLETQKKLSG